MALLIEDYSIEITAKDASSLEETSQFLVSGTEVSITFLSGEDINEGSLRQPLLRGSGLHRFLTSQRVVS